MSFFLAFETHSLDEHVRVSVPHALKNVAQVIALGGNTGTVRDRDGNQIGQWRLEHAGDDDDDWSPLARREGTK